MADETTQDTTAKPPVTPEELEAENIAIGERKRLDALPDDPISAVDRLRVFEDEKLGVGTPRQQGAIERGVGSHFSRMTDADKEMYAKIEKLVAAEAKLAAAHTALIAADNEYDAALKAADAAPDA